MYPEDDLLPISALQHLAFCPRQWGLIHLEGLWAENRFTVEGRQLHERAHAPETESRGDLRIARGLRLRSLRLGLTGKADVVEFHRLPDVGEHLRSATPGEQEASDAAAPASTPSVGRGSQGGPNVADAAAPANTPSAIYNRQGLDEQETRNAAAEDRPRQAACGSDAAGDPHPVGMVGGHPRRETAGGSATARDPPAGGVILAGLAGRWRPVPVEYKRGRPKRDRCDEVQLCAQALCLEEMLNVAIPAGALFYGRPRRRHEVTFGDSLRRETESLTLRLHELTRAAVTPRARYEKKCDKCSLRGFCLPKATGARRSARTHLSEAFDQLELEQPPERPLL